METYIDFNNRNSLYDFGLGITNMGSLPVANEIVEYVNGYTIKTGEYDPIELPITFKDRKWRSIIDFQHDIIDWLTNIQDNKLMFSFSSDKYYLVKNVVVGEITRNHNKYNTIDVTFTLEPFKYQLESVITLTKTSDIYYQGNVEGECNIKIYGSGNIQLTINNETIQINNVDEYVELDSKFLLCLNSDKTSKSRDMIGHFLLLKRGFNNISWTGNVSKVELLPRTAYK